MILPSKQTELFNGLLDDKATIFADGTSWQRHCIEIIPECVNRAHEVFGNDLPNVNFYFFSRHADYINYHQELFGAKPKYSWQTGTGGYLKKQGVVLISDMSQSGRDNAELGIVMHEYSHALVRARYVNQKNQIPTWLDEGFADYLAMPWYQELFKDTPRIIKDEANALRVATYQSFSRRIHTRARAGYAIARLMVVELMKDRQLDTVRYVLDEAKPRSGAFAAVIHDICGLSPRQLYDKVLADCGVDQSSIVGTKKTSRQRQTYWICWELRKNIPSTFWECLLDLYYWKLEHYGRKYDQHKLNSHKYPKWKALAMAYLHFLKSTSHAAMKKHEREQLRAMSQLDRSARLLTFVSTSEILAALWQSLPVETTDYLNNCIENLNDPSIRENLQKAMSSYLQKYPPIIDTTPLEAFTHEFAAFTSFRSRILDVDSELAKYDRWQQLATAFVRLLKDRECARWGQNLQLSMRSLVTCDEHRCLPSHLSGAELKDLLAGDLPDLLRRYLGGQPTVALTKNS